MMQPIFVFVVRDTADFTFVDEYVNFKVGSVQELKERIDLEGLFSKIIYDEWRYHERPENIKLLDVKQEEAHSFEVSMEFTYQGETISDFFTIDFLESKQSDFLAPFIKPK